MHLQNDSFFYPYLWVWVFGEPISLQIIKWILYTILENRMLYDVTYELYENVIVSSN